MELRTRAQMWYLSLEAIRILSTEEGPDEEELRFLRRKHCIPAENAEIQPVVFAKWFAQHYFAVVMDYSSSIMYVFGRHITQEMEGASISDDWMEWAGHLVWEHTARLFQWKGRTLRPSVVLAVDWFQVNEHTCPPDNAFLGLTSSLYSEWCRLWSNSLLSDQDTFHKGY